MGAVILWAWDATNEVYRRLVCNDEGKLIIDPSEIFEDDPTDGEVGKAPTSNWAHDHEVATTGTHGVGAGTIGSVSTANKTIYVDKAAVGAADGTSWADAFTTIQAAVDSMENILLHAYTIRVRKGATPYRETVYLNSNPAVNSSHLILGSLTIEAEYYWYGDCEANVGGAGEITDTGAFADVAIGDKVYILDLNGANGRAQDYELCTVDNIDNIPNRIGTDGAKTPTTLWKYVIVRTEISGSDDGTDPGTARDYCFYLKGIDNVNMYGFYLTFSDDYVIFGEKPSECLAYYMIIDNCDQGIRINGGKLSVRYTSVNAAALNIGAGDLGFISALYIAVTGGGNVTYFSRNSALQSYYWYIDSANIGLRVVDFSYIQMQKSTISANVTIGIQARYNGCVNSYLVTNNGVTPVDPVGTAEGAYINEA